jgi:hypothetical protein
MISSKPQRKINKPMKIKIIFLKEEIEKYKVMGNILLDVKQQQILWITQISEMIYSIGK